MVGVLYTFSQSHLACPSLSASGSVGREFHEDDLVDMDKSERSFTQGGHVAPTLFHRGEA
jgi:hypothetical protein